MRRIQKQLKKSWKHRLVAILVIVSVLAILLSQAVFAQNSYVITDGDNVTVYQSYSSDPEQVLQEVGITLSNEDTYTTTYNDGVSNITIQRMQIVTLINRGQTSQIGSYGETVAELLDRLGITLSANDSVSYELDSITHDGMVVEVIHKEIEVFEYDAIVPFETKYFDDPELAPGEEIVLIEGVNGVVDYKMQVTRENGIEIAREILDETVRVEKVNQLVIRGPQTAIKEQPTDPEYKVRENDAPRYSITDNVITTSNGTQYTFTDTIQVSATAYSCEGHTGICYAGTLARVGAIAVDPKVIPLGTKMYVVSNDGEYVYGYCIAEDIGGGIKGHRIDLYFDTIADCYEFGVRSCTVYFLEDNS